jgi:branched-chain amino acid transport system ATP-binding protein
LASSEAVPALDSPKELSENLLKVTHLSVMYGGIVGIRGLSLAVKPGEVVALLGPNGAGKSSALKGICGEGDVTGEITFEGRDISRWPPFRRAKAGLVQVAQGGGLFREMSVLDNLLLGSYGRSRQQRHVSLERVHELFPRLFERKDAQAGMLSGGEQQMLALGRALMGDPKLMLLDEPTIGLAPIAVTQVFERIRAISETGVALIIVDQNARQALALADHVCVANRGKIVYAATTAQAVEEVNIVDAHLGLVGGDEAAELAGEDPDEGVSLEALFMRRSVRERIRRGAAAFFT